GETLEGETVRRGLPSPDAQNATAPVREGLPAPDIARNVRMPQPESLPRTVRNSLPELAQQAENRRLSGDNQAILPSETGEQPIPTTHSSGETVPEGRNTSGEETIKRMVEGQQKAEKRAAEVKKEDDEALASFMSTFQDTRTGEMQRKRARDYLTKGIRSDGKPMKVRVLVEKRVADGWSIREKDGTRRLEHPDGRFFYEKDIGKTAMDYAAHLIEKRDMAAKARTETDIPESEASVAPEPEVVPRPEPVKDKPYDFREAQRKVEREEKWLQGYLETLPDEWRIREGAERFLRMYVDYPGGKHPDYIYSIVHKHMYAGWHVRYNDKGEPFEFVSPDGKDRLGFGDITPYGVNYAEYLEKLNAKGKKHRAASSTDASTPEGRARDAERKSVKYSGKIEDFGEEIKGAAKHRYAQLAETLGKTMEDRDYLKQP
ncbi:TPA: hypothetical protein JW546_004958, partial [Escherichia coli]|nr:hypothetical protein [Escherichia coli]